MPSNEYMQLKNELKAKGIKLSLPNGWDFGDILITFPDGAEIAVDQLSMVKDVIESRMQARAADED